MASTRLPAARFLATPPKVLISLDTPTSDLVYTVPGAYTPLQMPSSARRLHTQGPQKSHLPLPSSPSSRGLKPKPPRLDCGFPKISVTRFHWRQSDTWVSLSPLLVKLRASPRARSPAMPLTGGPWGTPSLLCASVLTSTNEAASRFCGSWGGCNIGKVNRGNPLEYCLVRVERQIHFRCYSYIVLPSWLFPGASNTVPYA